MPIFKQVTIVGLGLIGGSIGLAARRRRAAGTVVGLSRHASTVKRARARRAIDWGTTDAARAVRDADLVVIAAPVDHIAASARKLAPLMKPGAIITDVGSTKAGVVTALDGRLPRRVAFVGGHPVAGSEQRGIDAADASLFAGSTFIATPTARTDKRALAAVRRFWTLLGAQAISMSPASHDRLLAGGSHLPHLIAFALAGSAGAGLPKAPRSFLDMTRIAQSDPDLWDDIFLSNRSAVLEAAGRFSRELKGLCATLARRDRPALRGRLARARQRRHALNAR
jgi:prephenate dehydrogenase